MFEKIETELRTWLKSFDKDALNEDYKEIYVY